MEQFKTVDREAVLKVFERDEIPTCRSGIWFDIDGNVCAFTALGMCAGFERPDEGTHMPLWRLGVVRALGECLGFAGCVSSMWEQDELSVHEIAETLRRRWGLI